MQSQPLRRVCSNSIRCEIVRKKIEVKPKSVIRLLCTNKLPFCHLFHRFSVTMEPHCALKASKYLLKNINCYHHNANDRFGLKGLNYVVRNKIIPRNCKKIQFVNVRLVNYSYLCTPIGRDARVAEEARLESV